MARTRTLGTAIVLTLALGGCGGSDDGGSGGSGGLYGGGAKKESTPSANGSTVKIADFKFMPARRTVPAGTKLVFANDDTAAHTATANDRSFDTGSIRKGKDASVTLGKAGEFAYICDFHPFMKGTVVVE